MADDLVHEFLTLWHATLTRKDLTQIEPRIAEDVTFSSPARVTRTWIDGLEILLEFEANAGDRSLQGIDRIRLDERGRMTHLKVYVRPYRLARG